jgi:hypothetical protein
MALLNRRLLLLILSGARLGEDEEGTLAALRAMRRDANDPRIAEHRGRIVKTTGDGLLAEFQSVVDALRCAAAWQTAVPAESAITWRIGIHQGDIVVEDGDIFGDGVNIAARLEGLAEPGGICVSARVQEDAARRLDLGFKDLGEQSLKNIARPIRTFRVHPTGQKPEARPTSIHPTSDWKETRARFWTDGQALAPGVIVDDSPAVWFRMGPLPGTDFRKYGAQIKTALGHNAPILLPFRFYIGDSSWFVRDDGFFLYHTPSCGLHLTDSATFVFEYGEIWAINTHILSDKSVLPFIYDDLINAFQNFYAILQEYLHVPAPYRWQIGIEDVAGRRLLMRTPFGRWAPEGREYSVPTLVGEGMFNRGDSPYRCLRPFFEKIIARAGLDPDEQLKGLPSD